MSQDDVRSLRRIYGAMLRGSADELLSSVAHDIEWNVPETVPWGGTHHGPDGIRVLFEIFRDYADAWWDTDDFLDAGDRIVVVGRVRGRAIASGQEFEVPFAHVWGMSDGVPVSFRAYLDTCPIVAALQTS
jgi:ketosteroid isomerase-like protein